ncbi:MAG: hypothetical protein MJ241_04515 [Bacilli bacterium]|nr:hypothetical protein [Bacilli bacterium]
MKKSAWNYLLIILDIFVIAIFFVPFLKSECCVELDHTQCNVWYESLLSRMPNGGGFYTLAMVVHMLTAASGAVVTICSDLLKGDKKLIVSSLVLTVVAVAALIPVIIISTYLPGTC